MPSKCFIPGCKTGYPSNRKENKRAGIRNPSLFRVPKDSQLLEKWRQKIPRADRKLSSKDRVCELHFEKDCIEKEYHHLNPDGSLSKRPKGYPTLKKGSIPTIFPNLPAYLSVQTNKRKAPTPHDCSSENKHRKLEDNLKYVIIVIPPQSNDNLDSTVIDTPPQFNDNLEKAVITPPQFNDTLKKAVITPPQFNDNLQKAVITPLQFKDNLEKAVITLPEFNDFQKFSVEVKNMLKPNSWWSTACTEDFVILVKWNSKYYPERRVVICKDLSIKVFLMDVAVSLPIEECMFDNISELLKKVDNFEICRNADLRTSSGCLGFLDGRMKVFCSTCSKSMENENDVSMENENDVQRRIYNHIKKKEMVNEAQNIRRKNIRLEKKILDLKSKLAESEDLWFQMKEEVLLEVIADLPIQQQTAIKSIFYAKAKSNSPDETVEIEEENDSDIIEEELSS